jgi:superfamily II DNA or RNA helicase
MSLTLGVYEQVVNELVAAELRGLNEAWEPELRALDGAESAKVLGAYMGRLLTQVLEYIDSKEERRVGERVAFCNEVIRHIVGLLDRGGDAFGGRLDPALAAQVRGALIGAEAQQLLEVAERARKRPAVRPATSLATSTLFTGDSHEPNMIAELRKEIATSDRIDFLMSFVKFSGLRLLLEELRAFAARGGVLRVITTSYMGATDPKAVEELSKLPGAEIKISYDTKTTRHHAKSYVFWRNTGFHTLYIGSSNLSESAMTHGLEWNVKLSQQDAPDIVRKVEVTFEHYWNHVEFVTYVPQLHASTLRSALLAERTRGVEGERRGVIFEIQPYYYQQEILDKLQAERDIHGHMRNLVVAATGTGKTVVSAFDYRRFRQSRPGRPSRLLFVAHRKEILSQSLETFRMILHDLNFGDLLVGGVTPASLDHLFVSIQSFYSQELMARTSPDFYDYIVVDEFHHAAAPTYQELLGYYRPAVLLGLTATPERADGKSVHTEYFGGRIAAEIRLYEAIERKLLTPFHYFGVTDSVDLREVRWENGKYVQADLENVYVLDHHRARNRARYVLEAVERYCTDVQDVVGIGFCVSKSHAAFMAEQFNAMGVPSDFLVAESGDDVRDTVKRRLVTKEINFVFVVDIYNEGVDIPEVNTVLFLRPTESLTVYLQQLGRGLRLCEGKDALTVLDFVGHARREYNFEDRFKALLPRNRRSVVKEMEHHFPNVPRGCSIVLERQAQEIVLNQVSAAS